MSDAVVIGARVVQHLNAQTRDGVAAAAQALMAEFRSALDNDVKERR